jgi:hypothetical protein
LRGRRVRVAILRKRAQGINAHENESDHAILESRRELSDCDVTNANPFDIQWSYLLVRIDAHPPCCYRADLSGNRILLEFALGAFSSLGCFEECA